MYRNGSKNSSVKKDFTRGIITGADLLHEWILPWWWHHYSQHNDFPVAFFDFGLSAKMRDWCKQRGELISVPEMNSILTREQMDPKIVEQMEQTFLNPGWESREAWFKKPFACRNSPFEKSIWMDLDCQVVASIAPMFAYADNPLGISMRNDFFTPSSISYEIYQAGVIVFRKSPLLQEWADRTATENGFFRSDQELLSYIIKEKGGLQEKLPSIYNWGASEGCNPDAKVHHLCGLGGKRLIALFLKEEPL